MERRPRHPDAPRERFHEKIPGSRWVLPFFISMLVNAGAIELGTRILEKPSVVTLRGEQLTKEDFIEKLRHETLSPEEFIWAQEELTLEERTEESLGVEKRAEVHKKVQLAKDTFEKIIFQAQQKIHSGANEKEVANFLLQFFGDHPDARKLEGYSTVVELLTEGVGNCEARAKFANMALTRIYGEKAHSEIIPTHQMYLDPETGNTQVVDHVYATIQIDGKTFALDNGKVKHVDEQTLQNSVRISPKDLQKTFLATEDPSTYFDSEQKNPDFQSIAQKALATKKSGDPVHQIFPSFSSDLPDTHSGLTFPTSGTVEIHMNSYAPGPVDNTAQNAILDLHKLPQPRQNEILPIVLVQEPSDHELLYGDLTKILSLRDPNQVQIILDKWNEASSEGLPVPQLESLRFISPEALEKLLEFTADDIEIKHPEILLNEKNKEILEKNKPENILFSPDFSKKSFQQIVELGLPNPSVYIQSPAPLDPEVLTEFFQKQKNAHLTLVMGDVSGTIPDTFKNFEGTLELSFYSDSENTLSKEKIKRMNEFINSVLQKANKKVSLNIFIDSNKFNERFEEGVLDLEGPTEIETLEIFPPNAIKSFSEGSQYIKVKKLSANFVHFIEQDLGEDIGTIQSAVWGLTFQMERALIKTLEIQLNEDQFNEDVMDTLAGAACDELDITIYKNYNKETDSSELELRIFKLQIIFKGKIKVHVRR
ncbi:MAG: hypothetical protein COV59_05135 [Candidatus Magasanikbacteria bacterium CG11_big_fil_rev_8_21_14_0_20_39_34]|uniref:Transglutaminase-like domain-containing protein n=1 Tax=Candidatus Magasanikbacteria bacterium CG11_big_fil_rev_8_21_14_0_20_39_34 TaxID=1974653 RepID=A0A2H0N3R8_9BACT|nr:MAG: hypothetical protein COV59_05135 [Candidatus Magasanikbacteria bacterium CG11_big_fil_rev_8_21_14_0_20_39_34]